MRGTHASGDMWPLDPPDEYGGTGASEEHDPVTPGIPPRREFRHDAPRVEVEAGNYGETRRVEHSAIGMRPGNGEDEPGRADIARLELPGPDLRLQVGESRDDLDGDLHGRGDEKDVDRTEVAGLLDRGFEDDPPPPSDASDEFADVPGLGRVSNAAADRPELDRHPKADGRGMRRELRAGEPWRSPALATHAAAVGLRMSIKLWPV